MTVRRIDTKKDIHEEVLMRLQITTDGEFAFDCEKCENLVSASNERGWERERKVLWEGNLGFGLLTSGVCITCVDTAI